LLISEVMPEYANMARSAKKPVQERAPDSTVQGNLGVYKPETVERVKALAAQPKRVMTADEALAHFRAMGIPV
jgi:hypothetical protein